MCNAVILQSFEFPAQTAHLTGMKRKKSASASASAEPKVKAKADAAPPMAKWQRDRLVRLNQAIAKAARYKKMKQAFGVLHTLHLRPHHYVRAQRHLHLTMDGTAVLWQHVGTVPWTTVEWCHEMGGTHWKSFQQEAQDTGRRHRIWLRGEVVGQRLRCWVAVAALVRSRSRCSQVHSTAPLGIPLTNFGFACRVERLDLREKLSADQMKELVELFETYSVLVFKSANLTDEQLVRFASTFAAAFPGASLEASESPAGGANQRGGGRRLIGKIANFDLGTGQILPSTSKLLKHRAGNGLWHIDSSFKVLPALASLMSGQLVVPPGSGGETEFASSRAAYEAFPQKATVDGLICVHDFDYSLRLLGQRPPISICRRVPPARHFLVRSTAAGRSFFAGKHCSHVEGLDLQEGRSLIRQINKHITKQEFVYRHSWSPGDVVLCDNRSCVHRGRPWNPSAKRMVCLVKIAEGINEVEQRDLACQDSLRDDNLPLAAIAEAAPAPQSDEALAMLEAVGWQELPTTTQAGAMYCRHAFPMPKCAAKEKAAHWFYIPTHGARKAFQQILEEQLQPSAQTFGSLVNAAVRVGDLSEARRWLQESQSRGVNPGVVAYTTLLKGLCEAGHIDESREALKEMLQIGCQPNIRTANTLLRGYRRAGEVEASVELLHRIFLEDY
eukprot:s1576_g24.t1